MDPLSVEYVDAQTYAQDATDFFAELMATRDAGLVKAIGKVPANLVDSVKVRDPSARSTLLSFGPRLRDLARAYLTKPTDVNRKAYEDVAKEFQSEVRRVMETGTGPSASVGARRRKTRRSKKARMTRRR